MGRVTNIPRQPSSPILQAWNDYKVGRMMRKELEQLECRENDTQGPVNDQLPEELDKLECKGHDTQPQPTKSSPTQPQPTKSSPPKGWKKNKTAEFPWRLEQVVQEESNWRGTWVLEVKDMQAMMDWGTERVPNESGRGAKYQRKPTKHLPFPQGTQQDHSTVLIDGGQDDLMVWLGKR